MPYILGGGRALVFPGGQILLGVDFLLPNSTEFLIPYAGMSLDAPGGRVWFVARPGYVGAKGENLINYWPDYAAQAGFTFGKKRGYGFFAGFGVKDTVRVRRAGFYLFGVY